VRPSNTLERVECPVVRLAARAKFFDLDYRNIDPQVRQSPYSRIAASNVCYEHVSASA